LVAFTAKATAKGTAVLDWNTASEYNSKGFGIERQLGRNDAWQSVGYVAASNLGTGSTYQFIDQSLATATTSPQAYYRLRQEDLDGTTTYSPVAVVTRPVASGSTELVLSPVPATDANLSVAFAEVGQAGLEVAVLNTQGQRMLHFTTEASTDAALSLPVQGLAAGMYIVQQKAPAGSSQRALFFGKGVAAKAGCLPVVIHGLAREGLANGRGLLPPAALNGLDSRLQHGLGVAVAVKSQVVGGQIVFEGRDGG
nr:hypothetical protein [Tanacetum cinerariifolium]